MGIVRDLVATKRAELALRRARAEASAQVFSGWGGGYDAAREGMNRGMAARNQAQPKDEDSHLGTLNRETLRLEGADLRRNNPVVAGALARFASLVVHGQITAKHESVDERFNNEADDFWKGYKASCDVRGRITLDEYCEMVMRTAPTDGDGGIVLMEDGQFQPMEGERIASPSGVKPEVGTVVDGVHVGPDGRKLGFYVCPRRPDGYVDREKARYVPAAHFVHWARDRFRVDTIRGIGDMAPVINPLKDFGKLHEFTILKAKLDATNAGVFMSDEMTAPGGPILSRNRTGPEGEAATGNNQKGPVVDVIEGIRVHHLGKNGKYESLASNTPNARYVEFAELILRLVGAGLSVPYEFLTLDFKQGSYQANRSAILALMRTVESWHEWLVGDLLQPLHDWRLAMAITRGEIRPAPIVNGRSQFSRVRFSLAPSFWLDPRHEMTARRDAWNLCQESLDEQARRVGQTRTTRIEEKGKDIEAAMKEAQRLSMMYGQPVSWDQIINAGVPGVVTTQGTAKEAEE